MFNFSNECQLYSDKNKKGKLFFLKVQNSRCMHVVGAV